MEYSVKWMDPKYYGINWDADDEDPLKQNQKRIKEKPFCKFELCPHRVSTEFDKPKPFCKDHVFENPYVKDLLERMKDIDHIAERKRVKEWLKQAEDLPYRYTLSDHS